MKKAGNKRNTIRLMDTKVTVGLPCFNSEKTLELALKSIIAQTHKDWRLIIIDDGSSDKTRLIAQQFTENDSRIELIVHGQNGGLAACLNEISALTETDLLFRMDADDVMFPCRLEKQIAFMGDNSDCDLLGTAIVSIDINEHVRAIRKPPEKVSRSAEIFCKEVLYHPALCGKTKWFRRNPYNESLKLSQDFELLARTAGKVKIRNLASALLFYREYGSFTYEKYRRRSKITRNIILLHGPQTMGRPKTYFAWFQRRLKDSLYFSMNRAGLWERSLIIHNQLLSEELKDNYQQTLNHLRRMHIY
jgi:glycosyltransferase involved in cell wall biosynthesis